MFLCTDHKLLQKIRFTVYTEKSLQTSTVLLKKQTFFFFCGGEVTSKKLPAHPSLEYAQKGLFQNAQLDAEQHGRFLGLKASVRMYWGLVWGFPPVHTSNISW